MIHSLNHLSFLLLSSLLNSKPASALPTTLTKRSSSLTRGAAAGLGIGIAVASILLITTITLLVMHFRSRSRANTAVDRTCSVLSAREKHDSTATTITTDNATPRTLTIEPQLDIKQSQPSAPQPLPRRSKSIKDRLMGPLYQSQDNLLSAPVPAYVRRSRVMKAGPQTEEMELTDKELDAEYERIREAGGNRSNVPSYSSRRATRLMMMM